MASDGHCMHETGFAFFSSSFCWCARSAKERNVLFPFFLHLPHFDFPSLFFCLFLSFSRCLFDGEWICEKVAVSMEECAIVGKAGKKADRCDDDGDECAQNEKTCVRFFLSFALVVDAVIVKGPTFFPLGKFMVKGGGDLSGIRYFGDGGYYGTVFFFPSFFLGHS